MPFIMWWEDKEDRVEEIGISEKLLGQQVEL